MKKVIIFATSLILCAACSSGSSSDNPASPVGPGPGPAPHEQIRNVTDTSQCFGAPMPGATVFSTWHMYFASENFRTDLAFNVSPNSVTISNTCTASNGLSLDVAITVPAIVNGNTLTILRGDERTNRQQFGNNSISCTVTAKAASVQFDFAGSCLKMMSNGQTGYMVP